MYTFTKLGKPQSRINTKIIIPKHIIEKLLKNKNKEKIFIEHDKPMQILSIIRKLWWQSMHQNKWQYQNDMIQMIKGRFHHK